VVNNLNGDAFLYENNLISPGKARPEGSHFLKVRLAGEGLNTHGLGAKVTLRSGLQVQVLEQNPCRGFLSSVDPVLHFGLGKVTRVDSLLVQWNDGRQQVLRGVGADQTLGAATERRRAGNGRRRLPVLGTGRSGDGAAFPWKK
jgi:hypothetical protein